MAREIPVTQARDELADLVNRVAYGSERVILTRHGRPVAALVPPSDLAVLEQQDAGQRDRPQQNERALRLAEAGPPQREPPGRPDQPAAEPASPVTPGKPWRIAAEHPPGPASPSAPQRPSC